MGTFRKRNQQDNVDVKSLFPKLVGDKRPPSCFPDYCTGDIAWKHDSMVDSVELLWLTSNPGTFFSRYRLAIKQAWDVIEVDRFGFHGKQAKQVLKVLNYKKVIIVNAFLKRCYDAGKFPYVQDEIISYRNMMPNECYTYFLELKGGKQV